MVDLLGLLPFIEFFQTPRNNYGSNNILYFKTVTVNLIIYIILTGFIFIYYVI